MTDPADWHERVRAELHQPMAEALVLEDNEDLAEVALVLWSGADASQRTERRETLAETITRLALERDQAIYNAIVRMAEAGREDRR